MPMNITWNEYALFNGTKDSTFNGMIAYANTTVGAYGMNFAAMGSFVIFITLFILFRKEGTDMALMGSSFITTLLTFFLWAADLVPEHILFIFIFLTATSVTISKLK